MLRRHGYSLGPLSLTMLDVSSRPLLTSYSVLDRSISLKATDLFFGTSARRTMRVALCLLQLTQRCDWLAKKKKSDTDVSVTLAIRQLAFFIS
jgi:hypothetical protein